MKILNLYHSYLPKTQTWAFNLLLFTPNIEVFVGAYTFLPDSWEDDRIKLINPARFKKANRFKEKVVYQLLSKEQRMERRNNRVKHLINKVWGPAVEKKQIDLIHVHFANVGCEFSGIQQLSSIPYVVSFYGMDYEYIPFNTPSFQAHYVELVKNADALFCEGPHGKKILVEKYGAKPEKVHVLPLGVDVSKTSFTDRVKSPGQLNLVQMASYVEKKGHEYTVSAFAKALAKCPGMTLTLVGSGPLLDEMKELVEQLGIQDAVDFIGFIDYASLGDFLGQFQVFIHPSCYSASRDCEGGAPVVLLDAQATGMPVISTTHCDIPMEVINGETGILVEEKDVNALAEAIEQFYLMPDPIYQTFARKAREHVLANFSFEKNGEQNYLAYQTIVNAATGKEAQP